jgi:hypothetical protein
MRAAVSIYHACRGTHIHDRPRATETVGAPYAGCLTWNRPAARRWGPTSTGVTEDTRAVKHADTRRARADFHRPPTSIAAPRHESTKARERARPEHPSERAQSEHAGGRARRSRGLGRRSRRYRDPGRGGDPAHPFHARGPCLARARPLATEARLRWTRGCCCSAPFRTGLAPRGLLVVAGDAVPRELGASSGPAARRSSPRGRHEAPSGSASPTGR